MSNLWQQVMKSLQQEIDPNDFNIWIRPLDFYEADDSYRLYAPNAYISEEIARKFADKIRKILLQETKRTEIKLQVLVGNKSEMQTALPTVSQAIMPKSGSSLTFSSMQGSCYQPNKQFTFDNFVEGKSNQLALAAAHQVTKNPGETYNPLFIYGGVGLGKTHLMHAIGNAIMQEKNDARVLYLHSETFVADMVKALQRNAMNEFKHYYRLADALLIDDIQFFAGKDRSQEEFFHTFNALLDSKQQIILSSDRVPKAIKGVEERLKSRFGCGLTVAIEPPELETRVAILMSKAEMASISLSSDVAFFIAERIKSNVRELEGALKRVNAHALFTASPITVELVRVALRDLLAVHAQLVSIDNIQKTVADYYKLSVSDLLSKKRSRYIAQARQIAMALSKELTSHSLPEIGAAFGGRDHTTVLHACRKINGLANSASPLCEDYKRLRRVLSA